MLQTIPHPPRDLLAVDQVVASGPVNTAVKNRYPAPLVCTATVNEQPPATLVTKILP